ncbi:MAG: hypothetical protein HY819_01200 [Acidobacteria bacterium]|nr:hypothetical protein [Acidobacteriota bacterium]
MVKEIVEWIINHPILFIVLLYIIAIVVMFLRLFLIFLYILLYRITWLEYKKQKKLKKQKRIIEGRKIQEILNQGSFIVHRNETTHKYSVWWTIDDLSFIYRSCLEIDSNLILNTPVKQGSVCYIFLFKKYIDLDSGIASKVDDLKLPDNFFIQYKIRILNLLETV